MMSTAREREYRIGFGIEYDRHNRMIDSQRLENAMRSIKGDAALLFGGYTLTPVDGGWMNPETGQLVEERGYTLSLITFDAHDARIRRFADIIGRLLHQHSVVLIGPGGVAEFVTID